MPADGVWRGDLYSQLLGQAAARGINKAAEDLRARSVPIAPKLTGIMRQSAQIAPASPSDLAAAVVYNTPYVVRQHEELGYRHRYGQAKFLEQPLVEGSERSFGIIAGEMRGVQ